MHKASEVSHTGRLFTSNNVFLTAIKELLVRWFQEYAREMLFDINRRGYVDVYY